MLKLMELILVVNPHVIDVIERDDLISDFMVLLCIYKHMEVNEA